MILYTIRLSFHYNKLSIIQFNLKTWSSYRPSQKALDLIFLHMNMNTRTEVQLFVKFKVSLLSIQTAM